MKAIASKLHIYKLIILLLCLLLVSCVLENKKNITQNNQSINRTISQETEGQYETVTQSDLEELNDQRYNLDIMYDELLIRYPNLFHEALQMEGGKLRGVLNKSLKETYVIDAKDEYIAKVSDHTKLKQEIFAEGKKLDAMLRPYKQCHSFKNLVWRIKYAVDRVSYQVTKLKRKVEKKKSKLCQHCQIYDTKLYSKFLAAKVRVRLLSHFMETLKNYLILYQVTGNAFMNTDRTFDFEKYCYPSNFPEVLESTYKFNDLLKKYSLGFNGVGLRNIKMDIMNLDYAEKNLNKIRLRTKVGIFAATLAVPQLAIMRAFKAVELTFVKGAALELGFGAAAFGVFYKFESIKSYYQRILPPKYVGAVEKFAKNTFLFNQDVSEMRANLIQIYENKKKEYKKLDSIVDYITHPGGLAGYCNHYQKVIDSYGEICQGCFLESRLPKICNEI